MFKRYNLNIKLSLFLFAVLIAGCSVKNEPQPEASKDAPVSYNNVIVSLTFDDGDADNYLIRQTLADNNLHATFYVVSGLIGASGYMTEKELHGLYEDGNEIGGHTLDHVQLSKANGVDLRKEVCQDRVNLLSLGFDAVSFSYPFGYYDEEAMTTVKDCGYNSARIVTDGPQGFPVEDPYELRAMPYIVKDTGSIKIVRYVQEAAKENSWAILIFHHICDGCDQYAFSYDDFVQFAQWLGYQQQTNGLKVMTVGQVIGGDVKPEVLP
jgi:peptidoglycan/xylan/chitin deacetylase (PgdA/CDA1 family)